MPLPIIQEINSYPANNLSRKKVVNSPDIACARKHSPTKSGNPLLLKLSGSFHRLQEEIKSEERKDKSFCSSPPCNTPSINSV